MEKSTKKNLNRIKQNSGSAFEYTVNIVVHVVLMYVVFKLPIWLGFLTSSFAGIAWLLYISYSLTIVANFLYLFLDSPWFRSITQLALNLFSIVIFYSLLIVFPFDLNAANQLVARVIIYVIIFGTAIGALVELSRFLKLLGNGGEETYGE